MRRVIAIASAAALSVVPFAPGAGAHGDATIIATPGSVAYGYATPVVTVGVDEELSFQNLDLVTHNVTARVSGPPEEEWCDTQRPTLDDGCPILWSPNTAPGMTSTVQGTENLEPGQAYPFYCSIHPWMNGVVVTEPL